tara:strand:- start:86 stop:628 length:543 start_codon:yes stop_codon:yes gene_type:complete
VDVWSCGVILYALLCGSLPFDDENIPNLFKKIKGGIFTLPGHMSDEIKDLISRMLVVDPLQRITIPEIRRHRWFVENLPLYLSVTPDQIMSQFRALDEDVLMEVVMKIGFDRKDLLDALQKQATCSLDCLLLANSPRCAASVFSPRHVSGWPSRRLSFLCILTAQTRFRITWWSHLYLSE